MTTIDMEIVNKQLIYMKQKKNWFKIILFNAYLFTHFNFRLDFIMNNFINNMPPLSLSHCLSPLFGALFIN